MKASDSACVLLSRFSVKHFHDDVKKLKPDQRSIVQDRGFGKLLDVGSFSVPDSLLLWMIDKINPELCEFRNNCNGASIVFTKEMVDKVIGLPSGTRPVVLTGRYQESTYREDYKIDYKDSRRAPIQNAIDMLDKGLDNDTFFRTFFLVALATYLCPGTTNMLPLEYLGSLHDASRICEYAWGDHILRDVINEMANFQKKKAEGKMEVRVGGFLPLLLIIYMEHLDFPSSRLSKHEINYSLPRASYVCDD